MAHVFDLPAQHSDVDSKIVAGLERIGRALATLLGERARSKGLSPIQAQFAIFLRHHPEEDRRVGALAQAFSLTHATVSDAVSSLEAKGYVTRSPWERDRRVVVLSLTDSGEALACELEGWADEVRDLLSGIGAGAKVDLLHFVMEAIERLQGAGIISVARTCRTCRFFRARAGDGRAPHYCTYLGKPLSDAELRLDCPEHRAKNG